MFEKQGGDFMKDVISTGEIDWLVTYGWIIILSFERERRRREEGERGRD